MKKLLCLCGTFFIFTWSFVPRATTKDLEWTMKKEIDLQGPVQDLSQSADGQWIFILTQGEILIYSQPENKVTKRIPVDKAVDKVVHSASNNTLILTSRTEKILRMIQLETIEEFDISGLSFRGSANAPVTLIVFGDYECPYCAKLESLLDQVLETHYKNIKLVYKNYPIASHKFAQKAALAALAAGNQDKFWDFHTLLFDNNQNLNDSKIQEIAKELELDMEKFDQDMNNPALLKLILRDVNNAKKAGITGIPAIFINGKKVTHRSFENLDALIKANLGKMHKNSN